MKETAESHFDRIAAEYDFWKRQNRYYYDNLMALYRSLIPAGSAVVEIGCGTGDIISALSPRSGTGLDISAEMVEIARRKHAPENNIRFEREDITASTQPFSAEYVFLADVMEHVADVPSFLSHLSSRIKPGTAVIVSVANPFWESLLMLAERLGFKMPEGPHVRISVKKTEELFQSSGFYIKETGYRLLIPKRIPGSDWVNARFYKSAILSKFGFVVYWIIEK